MLKKLGFLVLLVLTVNVFLFAACNGDDDGTSSNGNGVVNGKEDVVITIGNLMDFTGVAAEGMAPIKMALDDMVWYYNNNDLIPGVHLDVVDFDDQYDPARDIPGYQKLKRDGADFIWTCNPPAVPILQPHLKGDQYVMFSATSLPEEEMRGGYVFSLGINSKAEAYTMLDWIAENDPDFPTDRPALVGGAAWSDGYSDGLFAAAKDYVQANPDKYEWEAGFLTEFKFNWNVEAEELKDCDYVFVAAPPHVMMRDFRKAGCDAKFLGTDVHTAFLREIGDMGLWEDVDGALFIRSSRWYNETGEIIDIANQLLVERHSESEASDIIKQGVGYIATKQIYLMLDIVREAVEQHGAENFSSETLHNTATKWNYDLDGVPNFNSYDQTKRISQNYYAIYKLDGTQKDINRIHIDWLPQIVTLD